MSPKHTPIQYPIFSDAPAGVGDGDGGELDFAGVYAHHRPGLIQTALRYVGDLQAAEDIVQDTLFELWEKQEILADVSLVGPFLNRCVIDRSLNYLRDHQNRQIPLDEEEQKESISIKSFLEAQESDESADKKETYELLFRAIDCLPARSREVILPKLEGLTISQIATALDLSPENVKTHHKRAYVALRVFLKL